MVWRFIGLSCSVADLCLVASPRKPLPPRKMAIVEALSLMASAAQEATDASV